VPVPNTTRSAGPFVGTGALATYGFSFRVFTSADVVATSTVIATGITTTLVQGTDYSVSLNANQGSNPGGTITLIGGNLLSTQSLYITSNVDATQLADLQNQGGFLPDVIVTALDKLTILVQQLTTRATLYGFSGLPVEVATGPYTFVAADKDKCKSVASGGATVNAGVFSPGQIAAFYNNSVSNQTLTPGSGVTFLLTGSATTGARTVAQKGLATIYAIAQDVYLISGPGVT
jgi:hypothetical protein